VLTSSLLSMLMEKLPVIIYIGAALLGKIGGEMIITDPVVSRFMTPTKPIVHAVEIFLAAGVIIVGRYWLKRDLAKHASVELPHE
jgi:predicted tellurium resistance membrane protein TerC